MPNPIAAIAASTVVNGIMGAEASDNAADAQRAAADQASATQLKMFEQNRADLAPWRNIGTSALGELGVLLGLPGYGQPKTLDQIKAELRAGGRYTSTPTPAQNFGTAKIFDPLMGEGGSWLDVLTPGPSESGAGATAGGGDDAALNAEAQRIFDAQQKGTDPRFGDLTRRFSLEDFQADPGYQFRLAEGQKALDRGAAARGLWNSGRQMKALTRFGQDTASNEFGNAYNRFRLDNSDIFNRYASAAGIGQTATSQLVQQGANTANNVASNQLAAGNARASGYVGQANALTGAVGQGLNYYQNQQFLNRLPNYGSPAYNNAMYPLQDSWGSSGDFGPWGS